MQNGNAYVRRSMSAFERPYSASLVRILVSLVSVLCTGHLSAISIRRWRLAVIECAGKLDDSRDLIELALFRLAVLAVLGVDLIVAQAHRHPLERQAFALGIHPDRHRGTGAEAGKQVVIGTWAVVEQENGGLTWRRRSLS